jgi:hypothetical protein
MFRFGHFLRHRPIWLLAGGEPLWTPEDITTLVWYDAADASTIIDADENGSVEQWNDKKGGGGNLIQTNESARPATGVRTLNGLNVLDFDGTQSMFYNNMPTPADVDYFMLCQVDVINDPNDSIFTGSGINDFQLSAANGSQMNGEIRCTGIGTSVDFTGGPYPGPSIYNTNFDFNGAGVFNGYVDATKVTPDQAYIAALDATLDLRAFANRGNGDFPDGAVGEFIVTPHLSTEDRQRMEGYLAWKWGVEANLPIGHPYKDEAPKKSDGSAGSQWDFSDPNNSQYITLI